MVAPNINPLCKDAELHYYDFLVSESRGLIPKQIIHHIEQCQHCSKNVNQLKHALIDAESKVEPEKKQILKALTEMLNLHFTYVGKPVTCRIALPFLPALLAPALEIKIPTPVTVHLANCQQCSNDLETIQNLNLNHSRLCRLSQLFADKTDMSCAGCSRAHNAMLAVLEMDFRKTNAEALKHLSTCPSCRKMLYQYRKASFKGNFEGETIEKFPCQEVTFADVFDYVVPYGIDPADDQYAKFRKPLVSHIRSCSECMAKVQRLHNDIYKIAERAESEVVTIYHIDESAKPFIETDGQYAGFPIRVEILHQSVQKEPELEVSPLESPSINRKARFKNINRFLRSGIAAAAVILIVLSFFLSTPAARAVTIEQLYRAIERVRSVYIASFVPGREAPIQEQWISKTSMVRKIKTENQIVVWDIRNGVRNIKSPDSGLLETFQLSEEIASDVGKTISGSLGLVPFSDLSLVPKDARWEQVTDDNLENYAQDVEIYDLTWSEKNYDGSIIHKKWRFSLSSDLNLPQQIKLYRKFDTDIEYNLLSTMSIQYLTDKQIQNIINEF